MDAEMQDPREGVLEVVASRQFYPGHRRGLQGRPGGGQAGARIHTRRGGTMSDKIYTVLWRRR